MQHHHEHRTQNLNVGVRSGLLASGYEWNATRTGTASQQSREARTTAPRRDQPSQSE